MPSGSFMSAMYNTQFRFSNDRGINLEKTND